MQFVVIRIGPLKAFKLFFLLPPGIAVVSGKIRVLLKRRIIMGGGSISLYYKRLFLFPASVPEEAPGPRRSCPETRMPVFSLRRYRLFVTSGLPYASVFALSRRAMPFTPYFPVSSVSATRSSTVSESSSVLASASWMKASVSGSSFNSALACFVWADSPLKVVNNQFAKAADIFISVDKTPAFAALQQTHPHCRSKAQLRKSFLILQLCQQLILLPVSP